MTRKHEGKTYSVIMGKLKGEDTMTEQAYRYAKDTWDADEARSHCKAHDGSFEAASGEERGMVATMIRTKIIRPTLKILDDKAGIISAIVSTEMQDRDGDIIRQSGWSNLDEFMKYPVLVASHNYTSLKNVIGKWTAMEVKSKKLIGTAQYFIGEGNEEVDWAWNLAKRKLAAYSVGFKPNMDEAKELTGGYGFFPNYEFRGQELLEISQVTIPANPEALVSMKGMNPVIDEMVEEYMGETSSPKVDKSLDTDILATLIVARIEPLIREVKSDIIRHIVVSQLEKAPVKTDVSAILRRSIEEAIKEANT